MSHHPSLVGNFCCPLHPPPSPKNKELKGFTYSSKAHHRRPAIGSGGGGSGSRHLRRNVVKACVGPGAGEGAVHFVVPHHSKGGGIRTCYRDGRPQCRCWGERDARVCRGGGS